MGGGRRRRKRVLKHLAVLLLVLVDEHGPRRRIEIDGPTAQDAAGAEVVGGLMRVGRSLLCTTTRADESRRSYLDRWEPEVLEPGRVGRMN